MIYNPNITIKKIDNGYLIEAYCTGPDQENKAEYVKKLSKVPAILSKWFDEKQKAPEEYHKMDRDEEVSEDKKNNALNVKIKLTSPQVKG